MIGLLPCAGKAERFNGLPKYLLPTPRGTHLLQMHINLMRQAGCRKVYVGTNSKNNDLIDGFIDDYTEHCYLYVAQNHQTMTQTVQGAVDRTGYKDIVLFGMPDTYFTDTTAYERLAAVDADVVVGCFRIPPNEQHKHDLVRVEQGRVVEVLNKPALHSSLQCTWGILLWKPVFWDYLRPEDPHVGHGLPRAIAAGLDVRPVIIEGGYWNIGTIEDYFDMIRTVGQGERVEA